MGSNEVDTVMLEDSDQLRLLAKILLNLEEPLIKNIKSETERVKYLNDCNASYGKVVSLLNDGDDLKNKHKDDKIKSCIAEDIHCYIKYFLNSAMQWIRNCSLRAHCVAQIKTHFDSMATELETLDPIHYGRLAEDATLYKECMWEYTNRRRSASARAICKAVSLAWKNEGIKFPDLVERHKTTLKFEPEFQNLEDAQKLQVYNSIIEETKTAKIPKLELLSNGLGIAVLVVSAGLMVLDVFTAHCTVEAIARNSLNAVSEIGAFATQMLVEGLVTEAISLSGLGEALGVFVVALAGMATGFLAGVVFMGASALLVDNLIGGGGKKAPSAEHLNEIRILSSKTPDGVAIANEIAHHFRRSHGGDSSNSNQNKPKQPKQSKQLAPKLAQRSAGPAYQLRPPPTLLPTASPDHRQHYNKTRARSPTMTHPTSNPTYQPQYLDSEYIRPLPGARPIAQQEYPSFPLIDDEPEEFDNAIFTKPSNLDDSWPMDTGATFYKNHNGSQDDEHNDCI